MRQTPGLLILPPGVDHQEVQILSRQLTPRLSPAHAECLLTKFFNHQLKMINWRYETFCTAVLFCSRGSCGTRPNFSQML